MFDGLADINEIITFFALAGAIVQAIFIFNFFYSIFKGPKQLRIHGSQIL